MAIDFTMSAEQRKIQKTAREFALNVLAPVIPGSDREPDPMLARDDQTGQGADDQADHDGRDQRPQRQPGDREHHEEQDQDEKQPEDHDSSVLRRRRRFRPEVQTVVVDEVEAVFAVVEAGAHGAARGDG